MTAWATRLKQNNYHGPCATKRLSIAYIRASLQLVMKFTLQNGESQGWSLKKLHKTLYCKAWGEILTELRVGMGLGRKTEIEALIWKGWGATHYFGMTSCFLTRVKWSGFSWPGRKTVSRTLVPARPRRRRSTRSLKSLPLVGLLSMWVITSPTLIPARWAGPPATSCLIAIWPSASGTPSMPIPPKFLEELAPQPGE